MILIVVFFLFLFSITFSQDYILTDIGNGVERIEVELITKEPINVQDSPDVKVYVIKFKDKSLPVAAGMSGSPLISNGKIIGALFAGYSFQKDSLAFVLPIEYMDQIKNKYLLNQNFFKKFPNNQIPLILSLPGLKKINSVNLFSNEIKEVFGNNFVFYDSYSSAFSSLSNSKEINSKEIREGSSISVALVDGDMKIFVTGTLTRIYEDGYFTAFGHSFMNLGNLSAPVYLSRVITIVDRYDNSFKLSAITNQKIGSIIFDSNYGVLGKLNQQPTMIPLNIDISVNDKKVKNYKCYVVDNKKITYLLSLLAFYTAVYNYLEEDLFYQLDIKIGFANGRTQLISLPSVNTSIVENLGILYKYLSFLSTIPSADNRLNFINFSMNISPQSLAIINNISILKKEGNKIEFGINLFDPLLKKSNVERLQMVFPTESINEDLYFAVGGVYNLATMFEQLGIQWTMPKDFNQFISFTKFFFTSNPKSLSAVIATKLYGAIDYSGNIIPLNVSQLYKYYLQYNIPFVFLSYYPIIVKKETSFIPFGYDIFQIDVNGSISKAERQKEKKSYYSSLSLIQSNIFDLSSNNRGFTKKQQEASIQELYEIIKDHNKENKEEKDIINQSQDQEDMKDFSTIVNLSKYEDLIDGFQENVSIDYQSNITFSNKVFDNIKVDKNFFKILSLENKDKFIGFSYNFDNSTDLYLFNKNGKIEKTVNYKGIFSDARLSNKKLIISSFDGQIIIINPDNFSIERNIKTDYILQNADFYKNYIIATNIKYPCSIVFFDLNGKKVKEEFLPFLNLSNLVVDKDNILVAGYGGIVTKIKGDFSKNDIKQYFKTYQENITSLSVVDNNLLIGTYPNPYLYVVYKYDDNSGFNRAILHDGFGDSGYIEDIIYQNGKIFISYKGDRLAIFAIEKSNLFGNLKQFSQETTNLNWQKIITIPNFYWFLPFVVHKDKIIIPYISNTFTTILIQKDKKVSSKGYYISKVFDSGQQKYLNNIVVKSEGNFSLFVRFGNNPIIDQTWTEWMDYKKINSHDKYRYFQYKLEIYPETTIYSILGIFNKINYKPFFIIDFSRKVFNSNDNINVAFWDPNGDILKAYLEIYQNNKWIIIDQKEIKTKQTDVNKPDFSTNQKLSLKEIKKEGKIRLRISVNDSPSNPSDYFTQMQEFEIFIDNQPPQIKNYNYDYKTNTFYLEVQDDSFVEAFLQLDSNTIPFVLKNIRDKTYIYEIKIDKKFIQDKKIKILLNDEANNKQEITI